MHHYAILLGGRLEVTPRLARQLEGARFVAADSGMRHAAALQVMPELWLGDFDSADPALVARYNDVPRLGFPTAKDQTDGALAVAEAIKRGASHITLVGGFGGQFDHALSHGLQLLALAETGIRCMMTSGDEEAYPLLTTAELDGLQSGTRVSVLGLTKLAGLSISGVRWPLDKVTLPLGSTWTLSNEAQGKVAVSVGSGKAVVVVNLNSGQA